MEPNETPTATTPTTTTTTTPPSLSPSRSPTSSPSLAPQTPPSVVVTPCAACKILRRRCVEKCVLAPYFPPTEPLKFTNAHRVFGASNIIKFLQELPESHRADAVSSMVYEANARIRDPVYGCAGAICQLQKQVSELQTQLAKAQAELLNMQTQQANLIAIICMEMAHSQSHPLVDSYLAANPQFFQPTNGTFPDDNSNLGHVWEPLWT
ncbi:LOB domain-containing protein 1 [Asimina triloba]